jgi:hypothetical protein
VNLPAAEIIDYGAFSGCTALTTVSLPEAQTIDYEAFSDCTSLTTVSLPEAQTIGGGAFYGCTGGTALTITLGAAVPTLGRELFYTPMPNPLPSGFPPVRPRGAA